MLGILTKNFESWAQAHYHPLALHNFIMSLPRGARVFDIGCGNESPSRIKHARPDLFVSGIDISGVVDQGSLEKFILASPGEFVEKMQGSGTFDAVVSNHNVEHVLPSLRVPYLKSLAGLMGSEGRLFLATPAERSIRLPHRGGTLNYWDDGGHVLSPLSHQLILEIFGQSGLAVDYADPSYSPLLLRLEGLMQEFRSRRSNRVMSGTWALYGFEQIIWANKPSF